MNYLGVPRRGRRREDLILLGALFLLGAFASGLSRDEEARVEAAVRATALYPFLELHRAWDERTRAGRRVTELEAERDSLFRVASRNRALATQAAELRAAEGLDSLVLGSVRVAEVYPGRPRVGDPDAFVLRAPGLSRLEFPVGVFTGEGLVGVARGPHGRGARGEFWSHPDFRVSVVTEDGRIPGILRAVRVDGQPVLLLDGAPFQEEIPAGTALVTTGIAGVYPPGIPAGRVREEAEGEAGWMKRYYVEPAVRPEDIRVVLVWLRPALPIGERP